MIPKMIPNPEWTPGEDDKLQQQHFLSPSTAGFPEEALFYLRSRGIGKAHAERMLMPVLKDPLYCYFTFAPEIAENFGEGVGTPYLHSVNHQRRAVLQSRKIARRNSDPVTV